MAVIDPGTSRVLSSRLRAVTTTTSIPSDVASSLAVWAAAGVAASVASNSAGTSAVPRRAGLNLKVEVTAMGQDVLRFGAGLRGGRPDQGWRGANLSFVV
jgi:hypothetical protein